MTPPPESQPSCSALVLKAQLLTGYWGLNMKVSFRHACYSCPSSAKALAGSPYTQTVNTVWHKLGSSNCVSVLVSYSRVHPLSTSCMPETKVENSVMIALTWRVYLLFSMEVPHTQAIRGYILSLDSWSKMIKWWLCALRVCTLVLHFH